MIRRGFGGHPEDLPTGRSPGHPTGNRGSPSVVSRTTHPTPLALRDLENIQIYLYIFYVVVERKSTDFPSGTEAPIAYGMPVGSVGGAEPSQGMPRGQDRDVLGTFSGLSTTSPIAGPTVLDRAWALIC
jgi:hypothetical protein